MTIDTYHSQELTELTKWRSHTYLDGELLEDLATILVAFDEELFHDHVFDTFFGCAILLCRES